MTIQPSLQLQCENSDRNRSDSFSGEFEGPEKTLEIDFVQDYRVGNVPLCKLGARCLPRSVWDELCAAANCSILDVVRGTHFDSYILSESSLFVYPWKVVIKTCGTTTLVKTVPILLIHAKKSNLKVEWVCFQRKNYSFPERQLPPHTSFASECDYLNQFFDGDGFVLGPVTNDHFLLYVADDTKWTTIASKDRTIQLLMYDLHEEAAKIFYKKSHGSNGADAVCNALGLPLLIPPDKGNIHGHMFDPCGYSMNALLDDAYFTIHVTPSHCSYASFETNIQIRNYQPMLKHILSVFSPKRFTMTVFADEGGLKEMTCMFYFFFQI
eukprot:GSMAST32.ASY1.ANO1.935.1 assembled CDS